MLIHKNFSIILSKKLRGLETKVLISLKRTYHKDKSFREDLMIEVPFPKVETNWLKTKVFKIIEDWVEES